MNFSICIDSIFGTCTNPVDSIATLKKIGFDTYEFWSWWDKDISIIERTQADLGLSLSALCTKFISLTEKEARDSYLKGLQETIEIAKQLKSKIIISQVGSELPNIERGYQHESIVEGLKAAAPFLEDAGLTLAIEPLNTIVDHPGYYLSTISEAAEILEEVNSTNVKILFDIYHQQISEGNLISNIQNHIDKIAHFHAAGNPGRGTILEGEINYLAVFNAINHTNFTGAIGLEYFPMFKDAESSLVNINSFLRKNFS